MLFLVQYTLTCLLTKSAVCIYSQKKSQPSYSQETRSEHGDVINTSRKRHDSKYQDDVFFAKFLTRIWCEIDVMLTSCWCMAWVWSSMNRCKHQFDVSMTSISHQILVKNLAKNTSLWPIGWWRFCDVLMTSPWQDRVTCDEEHCGSAFRFPGCSCLLFPSSCTCRQVCSGRGFSFSGSLGVLVLLVWFGSWICKAPDPTIPQTTPKDLKHPKRSLYNTATRETERKLRYRPSTTCP